MKVKPDSLDAALQATSEDTRKLLNEILGAFKKRTRKYQAIPNADDRGAIICGVAMEVMSVFSLLCMNIVNDGEEERLLDEILDGTRTEALSKFKEMNKK